MYKQKKMEQELNENTFMPKVNTKTNEEYEKYKVKINQTESRHIDLYNMAQFKPKRQLTKDELEFEKNKGELKFKPDIKPLLVPKPKKE